MNTTSCVNTASLLDATIFATREWLSVRLFLSKDCRLRRPTWAASPRNARGTQDDFHVLRICWHRVRRRSTRRRRPTKRHSVGSGASATRGHRAPKKTKAWGVRHRQGGGATSARLAVTEDALLHGRRDAPARERRRKEKIVWHCHSRASGALVVQMGGIRARVVAFTFTSDPRHLHSDIISCLRCSAHLAWHLILLLAGQTSSATSLESGHAAPASPLFIKTALRPASSLAAILPFAALHSSIFVLRLAFKASSHCRRCSRALVLFCRSAGRFSSHFHDTSRSAVAIRITTTASTPTHGPPRRILRSLELTSSLASASSIDTAS